MLVLADDLFKPFHEGTGIGAGQLSRRINHPKIDGRQAPFFEKGRDFAGLKLRCKHPTR